MMKMAFRYFLRRNAAQDFLVCRNSFNIKLCRDYSIPSVMSAWQTSEYGTVDNLHLNIAAPVPVIKRPDEVIIKVQAASVNPIDTMMLAGYGASTINPLRKVLGTSARQVTNCSEFPLTLGRDFSGTIVKTGMAVPATKFKEGDEVWGAVSASSQGTHAEYVVASALEISKKPRRLTHVEAASIPYVAATTWAAVSTVGWMSAESSKNKRVLIFGGSGGVGTFAIQLFKAWGAEVTVTCSSDAVPLVEGLGADYIIDYQTQDVREKLNKNRGFDFILDTVANEKTEFAMDILKPYKNATYVTIVLPFLKNNDEMGLPMGLAKSAVSLGLETLTHLREGKHYRWALFLPNGRGLSKVAKLVDSLKISPVIEQIYSFVDVPDAYQKVQNKHNRGKTVIDLNMEPSSTMKEDDSCDRISNKKQDE